MILDLLHPGDILHADHRSLPRTLVGDDAAQMNDALSGDEAETTGTPIVLAECLDSAVANVIVVGCGVRNLTRKACDRRSRLARDTMPTRFRPASPAAA